jgi:hypothetical protein
MKLLKMVFIFVLVIGICACTSKANDGAKYVGHWVEKTKNDGITAALDITDEGDGNYIVTEWRRDILGDGQLTKTGGAASTIKNGTLLIGGTAPVVIKSDGSLFYIKEFVR